MDPLSRGCRYLVDLLLRPFDEQIQVSSNEVDWALDNRGRCEA